MVSITKLWPVFILSILTIGSGLIAQEVPIQSAAIDSFGRIQLRINSSSENYYILFLQPDPGEPKEIAVSVTQGNDNTINLTEQLAAYPAEQYRVVQYPISTPADTDGDGIDDVSEQLDLGNKGPLNPAPEIDLIHGSVCIPDRETFKALSYQGIDVRIDNHLKDLEFVKFYILNADSLNPQVYFMNTVSHRSHGSFAQAIGIGGSDGRGNIPGSMRGEIIYHPNVTGPNGLRGVYRFEFEPGDSYSFEDVQMANEELAKNMQLLSNNFAYYPMPAAALPRYIREKDLYDSSRVAILLQEDVFGNVGFIALNIAEGYGLLRHMKTEERPNSRDVVIYEALPNEMQRVGGIITTVPQTPLSHVNLRAIQDNIPNAYIEGALNNETISGLIGKYVYYKVSSGRYTIREASQEEIEAHYEELRPSEAQVPKRDLSVTDIRALDEIDFKEWTSFGVKAANLAAMHSFNFQEGTIPEGFAIPFYYYDEFMKYNGFYQQIESMLEDSKFMNDYTIQDDMLSDFRKAVEKAEMPAWMWDELGDLHALFPKGTSLRCRSSTNNEDLPDFGGAGLYDSKTHKPDEGHLSATIKQVFAGLWNFRAFDERQFYRIDHLKTAMGVLVHPNYSDELANGVGVTIDPAYQTKDTYYLNTQLGEDLVTNPGFLSIPEEIILSSPANAEEYYTILRPSNLVEDGEKLLTDEHLDKLREYMQVIHEEFRKLYGKNLDEEFAMEIEYKVTAKNLFVIKQARPWIFNSPVLTHINESELTGNSDILKPNPGYPNPFRDATNIGFSLQRNAHVQLTIYNSLGQKVKSLVNRRLSEGYYVFTWDGSDTNGQKANDGLYFYQIGVADKSESYSKAYKILKMSE